MRMLTPSGMCPADHTVKSASLYFGRHANVGRWGERVKTSQLPCDLDRGLWVRHRVYGQRCVVLKPLLDAAVGKPTEIPTMTVNAEQSMRVDEVCTK